MRLLFLHESYFIYALNKSLIRIYIMLEFIASSGPKVEWVSRASSYVALIQSYISRIFFSLINAST